MMSSQKLHAKNIPSTLYTEWCFSYYHLRNSWKNSLFDIFFLLMQMILLFQKFIQLMQKLMQLMQAGKFKSFHEQQKHAQKNRCMMKYANGNTKFFFQIIFKWDVTFGRKGLEINIYKNSNLISLYHTHMVNTCDQSGSERQYWRF